MCVESGVAWVLGALVLLAGGGLEDLGIAPSRACGGAVK